MPDESLDTLHAFQKRIEAMPARRAELIRAARASGHTWQQIGEAIGMTHAGAIKAARVIPNNDAG